LLIGIRVGCVTSLPKIAPWEEITVTLKRICSTLLLPKKGEKDMGYYCKYGTTEHDMKEEHPYKAMYTCN
jgi:hypothetical protein